LRKEHFSVEVSSQCAHCQEPLDLTIDSDMNVSVRQDTEPLVFVPEVNLFDLDEPNIIESF
jgi:hypothetical protein